MRVPSRQLDAALREWELYAASADLRFCSRRVSCAVARCQLQVTIIAH